MNGTNDRAAVEQFLGEHFSYVDEKDGAVTIVTLSHINGTGQEVEVHSLTQPRAPGVWGNVPEMARTIDELATRFARGVSGHAQQMMLTVGRGTATVRITGRLPLVRLGAPQLTNGAGGLTAEAPGTPAGMGAQGQRLLEVFSQGIFGFAATLFQQQNTFTQSLQRELVETRAEYRETWIAMRKAVEAVDQLRHDHVVKELEFIRSTKERERWQMILPGIVNSITGRDVFPQSAEDSALIESMSDLPVREREELIQMLSKANPERGALVAARLAELQSIRTARDAELRRMLREQSKPLTYEQLEAEAAGDVEKPKQLNGEADGKTNGASSGSSNGASHAPTSEAWLDKPDIELRWPPKDGASPTAILDGAAKMLAEVAEKNGMTAVTDGDVTRFSASAGKLAGVSASWRSGRLEFEATSGAAKGTKGVAVIGDDGIRVQVVLPLLLRAFKGAVEERIRKEAAVIIGG